MSVVYPGADPEEVEEGISRKVEEVLEGLEGIKQYTTQSSEKRRRSRGSAQWRSIFYEALD